MSDSEGAIVGIDLGTTNSVVAGMVDGVPSVLEEDGDAILPSVVAFNAEGKLITGVVARNQLAAFPDTTIASVKRRMGNLDPIELGDQEFTAPEISAMILRRLRDRASRALGKPVTRAVITVPAFFDEQQRQATREAGELAGLKVERIINEPTAAALVYHAGSSDAKQVVVYDFGGGTFDVSVVRMEDGIVEVLSSKGDTKLGGDDLDSALMDFVADAFQKEHDLDLRASASTRYRLLQACEQTKIQLSEEESFELTEEFIAEKDGQPLNLTMTITRAAYEELIAPMVDRTIQSVDEALRDAKMTIHQIDDLVLVGGSTRTPLVQQRLREEFLREPSRAVDPDLAVALGAAVQAAMTEGHSVGPVLIDVTGHTLGIEVLDQAQLFGGQLVFSPIIHRNSPLPARYEHAYYPVYEEQERAEIHVLQGEHLEIERNHSIGRFMLELKDSENGGGKIVVRFDLTLDGTLQVTATQASTGVSKELVIDNAMKHFQLEKRDRAQARLGAMFDGSDELLDDQDIPPLEEWAGSKAQSAPEPERIVAKKKYPAAVELLEKAETIRSLIAGDDAADLKKICKGIHQAIEEDNRIAVTRLCEELDDILFYVQ